MSERDAPRLGNVVRWVSRGIGTALVLWALADDPLIGGGPGFGATQGFVAAVGLGLIATSFLRLARNARALALVLSIGFVLMTGELGVHILFSARYQPPFELYEPTHYRLAPNSLREFIRKPVNGGEQIFYRVNAQGYRGEELVENPALRIAVYGDSFIQAEFSTLENSFAERLEHHLSEGLGVDIEVVNAGVAGYGPDQAFRKMEIELPELEPDLVVLAVFAGNDFGDLVRNKLFRVSDDGVLLDNDVSIDATVRRLMDARRNELLLKRVVRDAAHALGIALGLREERTAGVEEMGPKERIQAFRQQHLEEYDEFVVRGDDVVHEIAWDTYDADVSLTPRSAAARYKARLMDGVIGRVHELTSERGISLVLVPIPHPLDVGGHDTGEIDRNVYPEYSPRRLVGILEEIGARRGIPTVDLFTPFSELGSEALYFTGFDDHWNDRGQDVAGELATQLILGSGLLRPRTAAAPQPGRDG